jgi:DNA-binding response OmpR family regulator
MEATHTRHISSETPRVMVVDGSKLVRRMIEGLLMKDLPGATVISCGTGAEAKAALQTGVIDLLTTSLRLPDMDGAELAHFVRQNSPQAYIPIIVVSGDVNARMQNRELSYEITDYFDKTLGAEALSTFIRGYIRPDALATGMILYVEDSRVVALATRKVLEKHGYSVIHVVTVEEGLEKVEAAKLEGQQLCDLILTDVYLKGGLTGKELLEEVRARIGYSKGEMPIIVMTGDDNVANQVALMRAGANDMVTKPTEEKILLAKISFQLKVSQSIRRSLQQSHQQANVL